MDARPALGRRGEDVAAELLTRQGFRLLARNYRCPAGEIDVIARRGDLLVFCEVKLRSGDRWGVPAEGVRPRQRLRIRRAAAHWLSTHNPGRVQARFDVVSVMVAGDLIEVDHLPDSF